MAPRPPPGGAAVREDLVEAARKATGYRLLSLDPVARTVTVSREGMQLDAGGIAKGFAADAALAGLRDAGLRRALVAAGGDLAVGDAPPGRAGWQIDLAGLDEANTAPGSPLVLSNCGISTSGDAEQWVEIDGVRYSHVLDPRTGVGLTGHTSATVVAADATTSDTLATAVEVSVPSAAWCSSIGGRARRAGRRSWRWRRRVDAIRRTGEPLAGDDRQSQAQFAPRRLDEACVAHGELDDRG